MIDRRRPRAVYRQIADTIAARIESGELAPGAKLPSIDMLVRTYGIARATATRVLSELRAAGLIDTENGRVARVRQQPVRETLWLEVGQTVSTRMPTAAELTDGALDLAEGVPLLVVQQVGEPDRVYPGDRWQAMPAGPPIRRRVSADDPIG